MTTYAELAPTLQKAGITRTSLEADIAAEKEKKDAQKPSNELPTETKARVAIVKDCYLVDGIEKSNGLLGIARAMSTHTAQQMPDCRLVQTGRFCLRIVVRLPD